MVLLCPSSAFESGESDSSVYRLVSLSRSYTKFTGSEVLSCLRELLKVEGLKKGWEVGEIGWGNCARMLDISQSKKG